MKRLRLKHHHYALIISAIFHLVLLSISLPSFPEKITLTDQKLSIPIHIVVQTPPLQTPKTSAKQPTKPRPKQTVASTPSPPKPPPQSLPGDRETPLVITSPTPTYPKTAQNNDWAGLVKLLVTIDTLGNPIHIELIRSSGHALLDNAFMRHVNRVYQFKPRRILGENKLGKILLEHAFTLEE